MKKGSLIIFAIIIVVAVVAIALLLLLIPQKKEEAIKQPEVVKTSQVIQQPVEAPIARLSVQEVMDIIKTDKDYNDLSDFLKGFNPQLVTYIKFGPNEYKTIKPEWVKQGLAGRTDLIDKVTLTDSTYWVKVVDKKTTSKGLQAVIDITSRKSLLLIASMSIEAGIGL